jgi:catechol 2,3-dioxygenase-like lactoylglutathione lyase family enzyme
MKVVLTMIGVNDLDESLKFYCDGLSMKLLASGQRPAPSINDSGASGV